MERFRKAYENIIKSVPVYDFNDDIYITSFTKNGMVKRTKLSEFKAMRYSKPICSMKLKEDDSVVDVTDCFGSKVLVVTNLGYALNFGIHEIPVTGLKASGVKSISLKDDFVVNGMIYSDDMEYLTVITDKSTGKRIKLSEFDLMNRARRGVRIIRDIKTNPYHINASFIISYKESILLKTGKDLLEYKLTELPISDCHSAGSTMIKDPILNVSIIPSLESKENVKKIEKENINLNTIDEKMMTIDDFLKDL